MMSNPTGLGPVGIQRLLGIHYYVRDLERSRHFYTKLLGFKEVGGSSQLLEERGRQRSRVFSAGACTVVCSEPKGEGGRAARYLARHPDGIGTLAFEVADIEKAFQHLDTHGGNPISEIQEEKQDNGWIRTFSVTSPFGDTTFRFVQRHQYPGLFPGMEVYPNVDTSSNELGFTHVDHITSNFQTMSPALLWLEHVLGMQRFWSVQFHTSDISERAKGSGLRSAVFWDPCSGVKFANNEPYRPSFKTSQINVFHEDNRGDGVQHVALATSDILHCVRTLKKRGVQFMPTPDTYYEMLPQRLQDQRIGQIDEDIDELKELGILVDGDAQGTYLLQIFLKDSAGLYGRPEAGPFFFEIIQRKGDEGFGAGNFRALFESIEREQTQKSGNAE